MRMLQRLRSRHGLRTPWVQRRWFRTVDSTPTHTPAEGRLQGVQASVGGTTGEEISRRVEKGRFFSGLDKRTEEQWMGTQHHFRKMDRQTELHGLDGAIREHLAPSKLSFNEELRRRTPDQLILTEIYREGHGARPQRQLRKGWSHERFIAKDERNLPIARATDRARETFGVGAQVHRVGAAKAVSEFPSSKMPEVAFIGRTNQGKSSLINAIVNAYTCDYGALPGTTTSANFYACGDALMLVDLPGYGFYNAVQTGSLAAENAMQLTKQYLRRACPLPQQRFQSGFRNRKRREADAEVGVARNVKRVFICVSHSGLQRPDVQHMEYLQRIGCPFGVIVTKTDQPEVKMLARRMDYMRTQLAHYPQCKELMLTSSLALCGIAQLQDRIASMAKRRETLDNVVPEDIASIV